MSTVKTNKHIEWCNEEHNVDDSLYICRMCGIWDMHSNAHVHQAYDTFCKQCIDKSEDLLFIF